MVFFGEADGVWHTMDKRVTLRTGRQIGVKCVFSSATNARLTDDTLLYLQTSDGLVMVQRRRRWAITEPSLVSL